MDQTLTPAQHLIKLGLLPPNYQEIEAETILDILIDRTSDRLSRRHPAKASPFDRFLNGLANDCRLGPYISPLTGQTAEVIVLTLLQALATATEGNAPHPALTLLERMQL